MEKNKKNNINWLKINASIIIYGKSRPPSAPGKTPGTRNLTEKTLPGTKKEETAGKEAGIGK